ncbi:isoflavone 2'-hydroxylase-like [Neltuma alba]|uniref:isoflavone 2'-hydroxylase-like n=1 Tax=Neltuma alba TaxID=207710 RepID=UPI0010A52341|nr:isoflavone 2'-hydroxylase-like [Prosopis alba]
MEDRLMYCSAALCLVTFVALRIFFQTRSTSKNITPGPPSLPTLGNILQLERPLFRFFDSISQNYGPIYSLRFGSHLAVVVSSLSAVKSVSLKTSPSWRTVFPSSRPSTSLQQQHRRHGTLRRLMAQPTSYNFPRHVISETYQLLPQHPKRRD